MSEKKIGPSSPKGGGQHLIAGSISGFLSCTLLQPLDLVKTRLQQSASPSSTATTHKILKPPTIISTARHVVNVHGVVGLWKGTTATVLRNVPGSGLYFYTLHYLRTFLADIKSPWSGNALVRPDIVHLTGGIASRLAVGFVMMPITVVKVRYESNIYNYNGITHAFSSIIQKEGFRGLFSGFGATAMRDAPFAGIYIMFYERAKTLLNGSSSSYYPSSDNTHPEYVNYSVNLLTNMCAGLVGGFGATLATQPFDLIKSRIQLSPVEYPNTLAAMKKIIKDHGAQGLFRGMVPRMLRKSLSSAISWSVYEEIVKFVKSADSI